MSPRARRGKPSSSPHVSVPLSAKVLRDGRLIIEIGVGTLAFAAIRSAFAWDKANPDAPHYTDPSERYEITDADGFAREVVTAMLEEEEDGSSMLSDMLDGAGQAAIEAGSEHFREKGAKDD